MKNILNKIKRKLHSRSGETLTETLVSVLIISVVSVGLAAMISTSSNINAKAKEYDEKLDAAVENLENSAGVEVEVTISVDSGSKGKVTYNKSWTKLKSGDNDLDLYRYTYTVPKNQESTT